MTTAQLEHRVAMLEDKLLRLENRIARLPVKPATNKEWLEEIWGSFEGDPLFDEAVRYGRQWRNGQNLKPRTSRKQPAIKPSRK